MRFVSLALTCVLITIPIASGTAHANVAAAAVERLRPIQPIGRTLLDEGAAKSPTFRRLVERLRWSDVIVYVDVRSNLPASAGGALTFIAQSATDRYLRITINRRYARPVLVALLGHELQHAVEVAESPGVNSSKSLAALYVRIGIQTSRYSYDSRAAQETGRIVSAELHDGHADPLLARHAPAEDGLTANGSISVQ